MDAEFAGHAFVVEVWSATPLASFAKMTGKSRSKFGPATNAAGP